MGLQFSIVIPNFNSGEVLERAIRSLIGQEYPLLQIIMVDAGSNDVSTGIIDRYRKYFDVLIVGPDRGQADGLNKGFSLATGDVFGWLCADDELLPGTLAHVAEIFETDPHADMVTGGCERIFEDGTSVITRANPRVTEEIGIQNSIEQPSTFWKAALHKQTGELDLSYYLGFDWDFWARMIRNGAAVVTTDRVLSRYYFSDTNKCGTAGNLFAEEAFRVIRKHGPMAGGLAYVYRFLYFHFDLKGCFDRPPRSTRNRYLLYRYTRNILKFLIGPRLLNMYNWHFASCQERNIKWY
ncbi:MAG TPA: glycosyltransferase [Thermodesulfobacteriaceae bacterium]|nr:glycosyltransferase [Thermodesulfobacteriaceae bacterium]